MLTSIGTPDADRRLLPVRVPTCRDAPTTDMAPPVGPSRPRDEFVPASPTAARPSFDAPQTTGVPDDIQGASGPTVRDPVTGVSIKEGVDRWSIKTGTDPGVALVNLTPVDTTLADLNAIPAPSATTQTQRIAPSEDTVFRVQATLTAVKEEADGDFHLILSDNNGHTMDAEVPYPPFAPGSPFVPQISAVRDAVNQQLKVTGSMQKINLPVTVTGVGFFDRLHGQAGAAANGIELHPVLDISFSSTPPPPPPPPPDGMHGSMTPNQSFGPGQSLSSTLHLDGSLDLQQLKLSLDVAHRDVTGLVVTLTGR